MIKRTARTFFTRPWFVHAAAPLTRGVAPVMMLHRFADAELGTSGHEPGMLRANLAWLRAKKFSILPLVDLLDRIADGVPIERTVAFTVDDGYADFSRVAAPIFAEFDCPVSVFVTTGFLDGHQWMWWDKVTVALAALRRQLGSRQTIETFKRIPTSEKLARINALLDESGLDLPATPPPAYAPISWCDARRLAAHGVTFGPHTVTHPVLSRIGDEQAQFEISESWRRVREETGAAAIPVFCYANGLPDDFSAREERIVGAAGMRAAMAATPGFVSPGDFADGRPSARFRLPRFGYADEHATFVQVASGIERAKDFVRAAVGLQTNR